METEGHWPQQGMSSHHILSNCNRHPEQQVTGFCASCLRERLAGLDNANARRASTSSASSSSAALKTIFFHPSGGVNARRSSSSQRQNCHNKSTATAASSIRPELRRCKSLAGGPRATAAVVEPQRKSCDVRVRSTLSSLFHQDDRDRTVNGGKFEDLRPMKDHIDLDSNSQTKKIPSKDIKEFAGNFWVAASILSKKLHKWRRKNKPSKNTAEDGGISKPSPFRREEVKKGSTISRRFRDTQSEIAVDSFGRRSCDIAPRFSLDAGRISFDDQRCSLDETRASWDGSLINSGRTLPSRFPAKLAIQRSDGLIPVEGVAKMPGCSEQTRDYYSDTSRRRRSLDRSSSSRRQSVALCDTKQASNANMPELFHWNNTNSLREGCSGRFDSSFKDPITIPPAKKSRLWSIWGFIHRRNGNRAGESQAMERSFSETWPELRVTGTTIRSSSSNNSVGARSISINGGISSSQKSVLEGGGQKKKKKNKCKEFVLDKSRSARYSPSHFDNGLLRFYLTPTRGSWRSGMLTRSKFSSPRSFTSSILRLY